MKKLLVTGFKAFGGQDINPSELMLDELRQIFGEIDTLVLPVSFSKSFEGFKAHWAKTADYDLVLMLGQAAGRSSISLERVALNWMQSKHPDENGNAVVPRRVDASLPEAVIVDLPLDGWRNTLSQYGDVAISLSAGAYVCNYLYFRVLSEITRSSIPALFVHLPMIPEQLGNNHNGPSMEFELQKKIIKKLISIMIETEF